MLRRDALKLGLFGGAAVLPVKAAAKPLPKRPPQITLLREKQETLTHKEMDDNFAAVRALIERLDWSDA